MIWIIGRKGQLSQSFKALSKDFSHTLIFSGKCEVDITLYEQLEQFVLLHPNINYIINCSGYTDVERAESEEFECNNINVNGVRNLGRISKKFKIPILHFSTDYVFNGSSQTAYTEDSQVSALNVYGKSKAEGERVLLEEASRAVILRTSWLYGQYGENFMLKIIKLMKEKNELNIVSDQIGSPTSSICLARFVLENIEKLILKKGIYHFSNKGECSWFDFTTEIKNNLQLDCRLGSCSSEAFSQKAQRPKYSVLDCSLLEREFDYDILSWKKSLLEVISKIR